MICLQVQLISQYRLRYFQFPHLHPWLMLHLKRSLHSIRPLVTDESLRCEEISSPGITFTSQKFTQSQLVPDQNTDKCCGEPIRWIWAKSIDLATHICIAVQASFKMFTLFPCHKFTEYNTHPLSF